MGKRILIFVLAFTLVFGSVAAFAATAPVSPITDATYASIAVDETGWGNPTWATDKGFLVTDAQSCIVDGRLMVPFRFAAEVFGGSATWESRKDGTTSVVTLYAPPILTETVTVVDTVTITNTVVVTTTLTVAALLPTYKLIKDVQYLSFTPTHTVNFWGLAPAGNMEVVVYVAPFALWPNPPPLPYLYPVPAGVQVLSVFSDVNGYFCGSFEIPATAEKGVWKTTATQGLWVSLEETFIVLGP